MNVEVEFTFQVMRREFAEMCLVGVVYEYEGLLRIVVHQKERTSSHTTVGDNPILYIRVHIEAMV